MENKTHEYLIPGKDLIIRDPNTLAIIPPEGMLLPIVGREGRHWKRRINDGTMTIGKPVQPPQTKESFTEIKKDGKY